jgi:hypothetical protein
MRRSLYASSAIHAGILLWVAVGGTLFRDSPETEFEVTGVTILSVSEFEALTSRGGTDAGGAGDARRPAAGGGDRRARGPRPRGSAATGRAARGNARA